MSYRPQVKADSNGTTQDLPLDAETVQGKTPVFTTTNQTVEGVKTYQDNQKFEANIEVSGTITEGGTELSNKYANKSEVDTALSTIDTQLNGKLSKTGGNVTGELTLYTPSGDSPRLTFRQGTITDNYNDWSLFHSGGYLYLQQIGQGSTYWETRATFTQSGVDFAGTIKEDGTSLVDKYATKSDVYTTSQVDSKLSLKADTSNVYTRDQINTALNRKSDVGHNHEVILDYGDTLQTIKIGFNGAGLTADQIGYIAGYTTDENGQHKIKDISKDVLKSWLGYAEVKTGILGKNTSLDGMTDPSYFWIVFPKGQGTNSYTFKADSNSYMCYNVSFIQGGTPGSIRYFKSTTTSSIYQTTNISFSVEMKYIRFKIQ